MPEPGSAFPIVSAARVPRRPRRRSPADPDAVLSRLITVTTSALATNLVGRWLPECSTHHLLLCCPTTMAERKSNTWVSSDAGQSGQSRAFTHSRPHVSLSTIARFPLRPYRIGRNHLFPDPSCHFRHNHSPSAPIVISSAMAHRCISRLSVSFCSPPSCPFERSFSRPSSSVCMSTYVPSRQSLRVIFVYHPFVS